MIALSTPVARSVGAAAEAVVSARGQASQLLRVFERSSVPMVMVDDERRFVEANRAARLAFRLSLAELRLLRTHDLAPPHMGPPGEEPWARLIATGWFAGSYELVSPDGSRLHVISYGVANALPGLHLLAFAPAGWPEAELLSEPETVGSEPSPALTPRELELLQLAAEGCAGPVIAEELFISPATVRTHFAHIYTKLGVRDRAAAVAKAMRLGLIA